MLVIEVEARETSVIKEPVPIHVRVSDAHVVNIVAHDSANETRATFAKDVLGLLVLVSDILAEPYWPRGNTIT